MHSEAYYWQRFLFSVYKFFLFFLRFYVFIFISTLLHLCW